MQSPLDPLSEQQERACQMCVSAVQPCIPLHDRDRSPGRKQANHTNKQRNAGA